jgi:hypothetical protein
MPGSASHNALAILAAEYEGALDHSRHHTDAGSLFEDIHRNAVIFGGHDLVKNYLGGVDACLEIIFR